MSKPAHTHPTRWELLGKGNFDVFVARFTRDGAIKWAVTMGGPLQDHGWGRCKLTLA